MNITEDYVSFETAKLLKEKGFNEKCTHYYKNEKYLVDLGYANIHSYTNSDLIEEFTAPTLQMAMKWLREEHSISIEPFVDFGSGDDCWWIVNVTYIRKDGLIDELCGYNTYEKAADAAIKYCLKNLI